MYIRQRSINVDTRHTSQDNHFYCLLQIYDLPNYHGIDIVAQDRVTGKLTAVQAKYYKGKVGKDTINSFIAETGKEYYTDGMIISSTDDWNKNAKKATEELSKDIAIIGLSQLQNANFDWQLFDFDSYKKDLTYKAKKLRDYQKEAISNALAYFKDRSRGKLIMAP